ncbi:MAG: DivIVA domain-containing protein [Candidatus Eisenbacteria bacterium]
MSPGQGVPETGEGSLVVKISPLDIRRQVFRKTMRGCDPEEVRTFLEMVASELENALQDKAMLGERCQMQEQRLEEYRQLEQSMRNSLVTADRIATESRDASEREAQRVVQDAHARAERILGDARERLQTLVAEIEALRNKREVFLQRFRGMLDSQIALLDSHGGEQGDLEILERGAARLSTRLEGERARVSEARGGEGGPARDFASNQNVGHGVPSGAMGSMQGPAPTGAQTIASHLGPGQANAGTPMPSHPVTSSVNSPETEMYRGPRPTEPRHEDEAVSGPGEFRPESSRPRIPVRRAEPVGEAPASARPAPLEPTAEGISRGVGRFFRRNDAVVPLRSMRAGDPRQSDPRQVDPRQVDPRQVDPRQVDPRSADARTAEARGAEPRLGDSRTAGRAGEPNLFGDPRGDRASDPRLARSDADARLRERSEGVYEISAADEAGREDRGRSA